MAVAILDRCVQPILDRLVDHSYGGFIVDLDARLRPVGAHRKSLEHAARTTMALGLLHAARPAGGYGSLLRHGCEFLIETMWDGEHGGFYGMVERDGTPAWGGLKHPHGVTYAARAFVLASVVLDPGVGADWARRSLAWLDDVTWDRVHAGYRGTYRRDNTAYQAGDVAPTDFGDDPLGMPLGLAEMNTTSDAIGMLVDLVPAGLADPTRLGVLVDRVLAVVQPPGILPFLYLPDWTPAPMLARTGHQFQTVRRLVEAGDVLGDDGRAAAVARRLADFALGAARHPGGGFPMEMGPMGWAWSTAGSAADSRQWWVQLEAIDAANVLANRATREHGREHFARQRDAMWWTFVDRYVDHRHGGILEVPCTDRHRGRAKAGSAKTHAWKDISHEVAIILDLAEVPDPGSS
jgi:mannobiose 2-epimerase